MDFTRTQIKNIVCACMVYGMTLEQAKEFMSGLPPLSKDTLEVLNEVYCD